MPNTAVTHIGWSHNQPHNQNQPKSVPAHPGKEIFKNAPRAKNGNKKRYD